MLLDLDAAEGNQFLYALAEEKKDRSTYFKHTVYGLLFSSVGMIRKTMLSDATLRNERKLPVVLSQEELR